MNGVTLQPNILDHCPPNWDLRPDRTAMGLAVTFQKTRNNSSLPGDYAVLLYRTTDEIVTLLDLPTAPFTLRLAAGRLLALLGDPRIRPYDPQMITIPDAKMRLGTNFDTVTALVAEYATTDRSLPAGYFEKECPAFDRIVPSFRMARFPVTNLEYRLFLEETDYSELPSSWRFGVYDPMRANHPVHTVSHAAAVAYTEWLSGRCERQFRLPTEAEWEYAASGLERSEFPWGDAYQADCANTAEEQIGDTTPVGIFPAGSSPFGLLDMAGNVEEWVVDEYAPYPGGRFIEDDIFRAFGRYPVARGGCFSRYRDLARCRRRHGPNPRAIYAMGFRLAETIKPTEETPL